MPTSSSQAPAIPHARLWSVLARTLHITVISILVGGHVFGAPASTLRPLLYVAIVTGVVMAFIEAYPSPRKLLQSWGLITLFKLALLCLVPFFWTWRAPIVVTVVVIASLSSHMSKSLRHATPFSHSAEKS